MPRFCSARSLLLLTSASALVLLLDQPAQAHGIAQGGVASGFLHPISAADHLLLLVGVGGASALLSSQLLLWALAGAIGGGWFAATGHTLPGLEGIALLALLAVAILVMGSLRSTQAPRLSHAAVLVAAATAVHAMLHGLEAPLDGSAALWWLGASLAALLLSGGTFLLLRRRFNPGQLARVQARR